LDGNALEMETEIDKEMDFVITHAAWTVFSIPSNALLIAQLRLSSWTDRNLMENPEFWWYKFGFQEDTQKMNHAGLFSVSNHIEIKAAALLLRSCA
ncbi:hypothetical protein T09_8139, partial [Trichinella sp. T9]